MPTITLDLDVLAVESFTTGEAPAPAPGHEDKASRATSCPVRPPVCTC
jgi:hypothetical protein